MLVSETMAMPKTDIDLNELEELMRLHPTLNDTAYWFKCSPETIETTIKKNYDGASFHEFREQRAVKTRTAITRKMIQMAVDGNEKMMIWYSKNRMGWSDKVEQTVVGDPSRPQQMSIEITEERVKEIVAKIEGDV